MVDLENNLNDEMVRADIAEEHVGQLLGDKAVLQDTVLNMGTVIEHLHYEKNLIQFSFDQLKAFLVNAAAAAPAPPPAPTQIPMEP